MTARVVVTPRSAANRATSVRFTRVVWVHAGWWAQSLCSDEWGLLRVCELRNRKPSLATLTLATGLSPKM